MGDKRPAAPLPLENKLLKTLSASVASSTGRGNADGAGGGHWLHSAPLENSLLSQLSLRSSALTRASPALPLRSSILAKYEAKYSPAPPPPPPAAAAPPGPQMAYMAGPMLFGAPAGGVAEEMLCSEEAELDEADDDMALAMCDSAGGMFASRGFGAARPAMKKRARGRGGFRFGGGARLFTESNESWAMPEPQYDFKDVDLGHEFDDQPTWRSPDQADQPELERTRTAKLDFLTAVCVSLVSQPDFKDKSDALRQSLIEQGRALAQLEPEFILKMALYARQELYLRGTSNFLLSLAALLEPCRPFLKKYFCAAVRLPTDWIDVAEMYQLFDDTKLNFGSLPAALRKVMSDKFGEFDNYQLAKYNKGGKTKKKADKKKSVGADAPTPDEDDEELRRRSFTIKKLVRLLHVRRPVEPVMAIVGKKYPADPDEFRRSGLPGTFDSSRAGRRMRLPVPETWETQVAMHGNKAAVWQQLIDHKKLPYMAMLRNLRNLILAGIGCTHHDKVIKTLTNQTAVLNSKQMVFRYLSAYAALDDLEVMMKEAIAAQTAAKEQEEKRERPDGGKFSADFWKARKKRVLLAKKQKVKYDIHMIQQYRSALDRAVEIATVHNVPPIAGCTLILCDVSDRMDHVCASAKGMGKPKTARTMALLLSLMCQRSAEQCELVLFGGIQPRRLARQRRLNLLKQAADTEAQLDRLRQGPAAAADWSEPSDDDDSGSGSSVAPMDWSDCTLAYTDFSELGYTRAQLADGIGAIEAHLDECLHHRAWVDTVVVMGSGAGSWHLNRTLQLYRDTVNPNLQFVNVDLTHTKEEGSFLAKDPLNISLFGFSDQILRFVAERGTAGQLAAVDAIDVKYNLRRDIRLPPINLREAILASEAGVGVARWRTVRVFISSTFLDFHGERDLLIRHALPELRSRARALRLDLQVVDLRWGITVQDSESARQTELCLSEIDRCQLFVGLLGARAGQVADTSRVTEPRLLEFLRTQPAGLSLTALEMLYATRDPERAQETALFYHRDDSFLSLVPGELMSQFCDLAPGRRRVAELRAQLQSRGCVVTSYRAKFGPLGRHARHGATDLQTFGENVLESLWNTLQMRYPLEDSVCDLVTEEYTLQHESAVSRPLVGRKSRLARAVEEAERGQGRFIMVSGKPGSGKTSFMARVYTQLCDTSDHVTRLLVPAFCSAGQLCGSSAGLLAYLRALLARQPLSSSPRHQLTAELAELLAVRGRRQHLIIVLDGLDTLWAAEGETAADWLPDRLPQNVTVLVSADDGGPLYRRINSLPMVIGISLGPLDLSERSGLVREMLQHHSKTLEEKAWNNQMRTLTSKRGAGDPLYLHLACEELRTFGVFEQLSGKLSSLGQTVSALIQDIISRLEETFDTHLVRRALCAVTITTHGLAEDDLFEYLKDDQRGLTQFTFTSLLRSGECLLQRCAAPGQPALLKVAHAEMARSIRSRYLSGPAGPAATRELARSLAEFFERRGGLCEDKFHWQVPPSVLQALPFFWGLAEDMDEYRRAICSLRYLMLKTQCGLAAELLGDVRAAHVADSPARRQYLQHPHVQEVVEFVSHNLHLFFRSPSLVLQQALNEPADSWLRECGDQLSADLPPGSAVIRLGCQARTTVTEPRTCQMTLRPTEAVTAVAADADRELLYLGLPSGAIKLYDLQSGRETRTYTGHGEPVTCLTLLSDGVHLVSGAADGQLSVWHADSGRRLAVTSAHRRRLSSLAVQPDGAEFVSVSWSCDIKLWRFRASAGIGSGGGELQEVKVLSRDSRPISCAAFHPSRPLVATGGWDGKIKIWDTTDMQRKAVRHGHKTSVRCLAISPDASYIVSGDVDGYLIVWGTKHGDAIQRSLVHDGPIQAVCYLGAEKFVTAGADGDVKLWRSHVGSELHQLPSSSPVLLAAAAPSGSVLTVTSGGEVALQAVAADGGAARWSRRLENISRAACDARRVYLAVGRAVHVLKLADGRPERQLAADATVTSLACLPPEAADSQLGVVLLGLEDGRVGVALADRGDLVSTVAHAGEVTDIAIDVSQSDRPRMATGGRDGMVLLWSGEDSWQKPFRSLEAYSVPVSALAWLDGKLITAGQDSQMHVYSGSDFSDCTLITGNDAPVFSLSVSGHHLLGATAGGQVLLWTSRLVAVTEQRCRPGSRPDLARLTDGRLAALLPRQAATSVVDLQKMSCLASFGDHTAGVSGVDATKHSLVSASLDGSAKLWRTDQTTVASTDAGFLAVEHLWTAADRVTCFVATVSRDGHVTTWKVNWSDGKIPEALYSVHLFDQKDESVCVQLAAIGGVSAAGDRLSFSAGCLTRRRLTRLDVTVPLEGAGGYHERCATAGRPTDAPAVCLAVGQQRCLMVGDTVGRVSVFDAEMQKHAQYRCGADPDPALTHVHSLAGGTVITCDRNGMLCRLQQTDKLNILRATWEPVLLPAASLQPPPAAGCQLAKDAPRPTASPPTATQRAARRPPTALLATDTESVLGDGAGELWWHRADQHMSMRAHSAAVTWIGRDPARPDILYSSGADRRLVVWRSREDPTELPDIVQVGEFEFVSSVRACALLPAAAGQPSRLVCADDRGRLHCLQVELAGVPEARPRVTRAVSEESGRSM